MRQRGKCENPMTDKPNERPITEKPAVKIGDSCCTERGMESTWGQ